MRSSYPLSWLMGLRSFRGIVHQLKLWLHFLIAGFMIRVNVGSWILLNWESIVKSLLRRLDHMTGFSSGCFLIGQLRWLPTRLGWFSSFCRVVKLISIRLTSIIPFKLDRELTVTPSVLSSKGRFSCWRDLEITIDLIRLLHHLFTFVHIL